MFVCSNDSVWSIPHNISQLSVPRHMHRVSFRKKKSSKNVDSTPKEGAAATPTEKAADDAREPEVSFGCMLYCCCMYMLPIICATFRYVCYILLTLPALIFTKLITHRPRKHQFHPVHHKWKIFPTYLRP